MAELTDYDKAAILKEMGVFSGAYIQRTPMEVARLVSKEWDRRRQPLAALNLEILAALREEEIDNA